MTGEQLFMYYADPCADSLVRLGKLDQQRRDRLTELIHNGGRIH